MGYLFRRRSARRVDDVLDVHGPARCVAAVAALTALAADPQRIAREWERCELPLVHALPDCPPATKAPLRRALEDCAGACRNREIARRIMVVRDSLLA
jgi:hypothetical protein